MWLSKCAVTGANQSELPEIGTVTISGSPLGILCDSETRNVALTYPGGFRWHPKAGSDVLVLKCAGGEQIALAQLPDDDTPELEPGELIIKSDSGSFIKLDNNGAISISGSINLKGPVTLNGIPLVSCACKNGE